MANSYYAQSDYAPPTMTVGELIEKLKAFDLDDPVIFESPFHGAYGPLHAYSIDAVERKVLEREELHTPASIKIDEETGETYTAEADTQVFNAWSGVVIR